MKTQPIRPARIDFGSSPEMAPQAPDFGDIYHPRIGAWPQALHVFLAGNGLPGRWAGRDRFVILETGFGLGNNFLATWQAWRADPARCERLFYVAIERHPPRREDLNHAHRGQPHSELADALVQAWPPLTPNLHQLHFDEGRVSLLLALGDVAQLLPGLRVQADAFYLDGFAPARNPEMWQPRVLKALGRKAAPGATLATWTAARAVREGLRSAGFDWQHKPGIGGKREITVARHEPHPARGAAAAAAPMQLRPPRASRPTSALVIGAGVAGASVALALAKLGLAVTVLEQHAQPAQEGSGNPAALFHGTVNPDDGPYARLFRAAALHAQRLYGPACAADPTLGSVHGLLRLELREDGQARMQATLQTLGLPSDWVRAVDATAASALAGIPLSTPAWHYPGGGWIAPPRWIRLALRQPGISLLTDAAAARLAREDGNWIAHGADGQVLAGAPILVVACAAAAARLLAPWLAAPWPLSATQGQVTHWAGPRPAGGAALPHMPVAGDGYAIPLPDGGLLCGATRHDAEVDDMQAEGGVTEGDHQLNLERLHRLTGLAPPDDAQRLSGRSGWRLHTDDRLPIAGALPLREMPIGQRLDQARLLPREPGLFVLTALGARGLTLAPLLGALIAAQATDTPWPLEQDLVDAVDPARWGVRSARRASSGPSEGLAQRDQTEA